MLNAKVDAKNFFENIEDGTGVIFTNIKHSLEYRTSYFVYIFSVSVMFFNGSPNT